eukprot:6484075-Amphidinium_carterae.1
MECLKCHAGTTGNSKRRIYHTISDMQPESCLKLLGQTLHPNTCPPILEQMTTNADNTCVMVTKTWHEFVYRLIVTPGAILDRSQSQAPAPSSFGCSRASPASFLRFGAPGGQQLHLRA